MTFTDRIVRNKERRIITSVPDVTWWRWEKEGKAPKRIALGPRYVGWRLSDLVAWIASRERKDNA